MTPHDFVDNGSGSQNRVRCHEGYSNPSFPNKILFVNWSRSIIRLVNGTVNQFLFIILIELDYDKPITYIFPTVNGN